MKSLPRFLKILFLSLFLLQLLGLAVLLVLPQLSQAADIKFTPQVSIGTEFTGEQTIGETTIGEYIQAIYKYAIGAVGILATVVLMFGGILWLTAGGNQERVTNAKSWITASLTGLVLTLCSYLILATVNPALTTFKPIKVATVMALGCCTYTENGASKTESINETDCKTKKGTFSKNVCSDREKICKEFTTRDNCEAISKCFWYGGTCRDDGSLDLKKEDCNADTEGQKCHDGIVSGVCKNNTCFLCESKKGEYCSFTPCCPGLTCNTKGLNTCE